MSNNSTSEREEIVQELARHVSGDWKGGRGGGLYRTSRQVAEDLYDKVIRAGMKPVGDDEFVCPLPIVRPLNTKLDRAVFLQEVWDVFVKPHQEEEIPPSTEMRMLMAALRAMYAGLERHEAEASQLERQK